MNTKNVKIVALLLSLAMLFSAIPYAVSAQEGLLAENENAGQSNLFTLSAVQSNDYSTVTVSISAYDIFEFTGATFIVEYDSEIIILPQNGVVFADGLGYCDYGTSAGRVTCTFMSSSVIDLSSSNHLAKLTFNTIKSGDSKLKLNITAAISGDDTLLDDADITVSNESLNVYIPEPSTTTPPPTTPPTTEPPTVEPPTVEPPTAEPPTVETPTTETPTAEPPTTELPTANTTEPTTKKPTSPIGTTKEQDNTPSSLILIDANSADLDHVAKKVKKIPSETEVSAFMSLFNNKNLVVKNKNGELINGNDIVGTGSTVELYKNGGISTGVIYSIAVTGDINGDGLIKTVDARLALRAAVNIDTLEGVYFDAANIGGGEKITVSNARKILRVAVNIDPKF